METLGNRAGLHRTEIGHLEHAGREPRLTTIMRVAHALDISASRLLEGVDLFEGSEHSEPQPTPLVAVRGPRRRPQGGEGDPRERGPLPPASALEERQTASPRSPARKKTSSSDSALAEEDADLDLPRCIECGRELVDVEPGEEPPTTCEDCIPETGPGSPYVDRPSVNLRQLRVAAGLERRARQSGGDPLPLESGRRRRSQPALDDGPEARSLAGRLDRATDRSDLLDPGSDSPRHRSPVGRKAARLFPGAGRQRVGLRACAVERARGRPPRDRRVIREERSRRPRASPPDPGRARAQCRPEQERALADREGHPRDLGRGFFSRSPARSKSRLASCSRGSLGAPASHPDRVGLGVADAAVTARSGVFGTRAGRRARSPRGSALRRERSRRPCIGCVSVASQSRTAVRR
jgi:hypothetical protein